MENPVKDYYSDYSFPSLPVIEVNSYQEALSAAKASKTSAMFVNTKETTLENTAVRVDLNFSGDIQIVVVLNLVLRGSSSIVVTGKNFTVSNVEFVGGSTSRNPSEPHFVTVSASNVSIVNFAMKNVKCKAKDLDYFRVTTSARNCSIWNSLFEGKTNNGVFLRLDFPLDGKVQNCVFLNVDKGSKANGGEAIRIATSSFESRTANFLLESCYFKKCVSDPEIVSIKCSGVSVKKCIFTDCDGCRLVLRHAHNAVVERCFFDGTGIRAYGTKHRFTDLQLVDNSTILLDNKTGSYVRARDCTLTNIYYMNCRTPIINNGVNCIVRNLENKLEFTEKNLLTAAPAAPAAPTTA